MQKNLKSPSQTEFIAIMAVISGIIAFSIDAMMPAIPDIARDVSPADPEKAKLVITIFMLGLGSGTLFTGVLSDWLGRKPVILCGIAVYGLCALLAVFAQSIETLLICRFLQGVAASAPRVVALAVVRDLYKGAQMARIMSFIMTVFMIVPAIAPAFGQIITINFGWHAIFIALAIFAITSGTWVFLRLPETHAPENRSPVRISELLAACKELARNQTVVSSTLASTLIYSLLALQLSTIQHMFDQTYDKAENFPRWFALIAIIAASSTILNGKLVVRLGMRRMIRSALALQMGTSSIMVIATIAHMPLQLEFAVFFMWAASVFFILGFTMGNLNALAMEPVGHIAGKAASIISAFSNTFGAALAIAITIYVFKGTPLYTASATLLIATLAFILTLKIKRPTDPED